MILLWDKTDQSPVVNAQQAEHYIQRKTMQAFIHARRQIEDSIGHQYGWKSAQWFIVYMLLNLWLYKAGGDGALYTDAQLNAAIYSLLTALYIPVHSPGGWNLGYLLSLIINLYIFVAAVKNEHAFWVYRIIKLRWYQHLKIVLCKLFLLAVALMELLVFYVVPAMTADQKKCEISYDLCFLHSADMYYYDTFMTYCSSAAFFYSIYLVIFTLTLRVIDR
jgi:hypothetical protein